MTTFCDECEHLADEKAPPFRWQCMKHPNLIGHGFASEKMRIEEPYLYCRAVNGGACPLFQKRKGKQMELGNVE